MRANLKAGIERKSLLAVAMVALVSSLHGATIFWGNPGTGNWNEPTNWVGGAVPVEDEARITNGGVAVIDASQEIVANYITIGPNAGTSGALYMTGGKLNARGINLGTNSFGWGGLGLIEQSGGEIVIGGNGLIGFGVGRGTNALGVYNITGGTLNLGRYRHR